MSENEDVKKEIERQLESLITDVASINYLEKSLAEREKEARLRAILVSKSSAHEKNQAMAELEEIELAKTILNNIKQRKIEEQSVGTGYSR